MKSILWARQLFLSALLAGCAHPLAPPSPPPATAAPTPSPAIAARTFLPTVSPSPAHPHTRTPAHTHTPTPSHSDIPIHILFTGDINPGRCPAQIALAHGDFTLPYQAVAEVLRAADLTVGSLDGSISDLSPPSPCPQTMNLIGPSRTVEGLSFAGFDLLTVATNHAKDCGSRGWVCQDRSFQDTLRYLGEAGIQPVGGGQDLAEALVPVVVEHRGVRFAFLGLNAVGPPHAWAAENSPGTAPLADESLPMVLDAIAAARVQADVVIVLPQWGTEYAEFPDAEQLRWAAQMIAAGATMVVGNHPHVIQPVETFSRDVGCSVSAEPCSISTEAVVAYALGNFVFDQGPWRTRQGIVLEAVFEGPQLSRWRLLPIHILSLHQPHWADPTEAAAILGRIEAASIALPGRDP